MPSNDALSGKETGHSLVQPERQTSLTDDCGKNIVVGSPLSRVNDGGSYLSINLTISCRLGRDTEKLRELGKCILKLEYRDRGIRWTDA